MANSRKSVGFLAGLMDRLFLEGEAKNLRDHLFRRQVALQGLVPYESYGIFDELCANIPEILLDPGLDIQRHTVGLNGNSVQFVRMKKGDLVIEPVYDYYPSGDFIPWYSLVSEALLRNAAVLKEDGALEVMAVWVKGHQVAQSPYPILSESLLPLVGDALNPEHKRPGPPCVTCPAPCPDELAGFENLVLEWLKAKQDYLEKEALVKRHLTYEGPTKVGAHLYYMDEHERRFFKENSFAGLAAEIEQHGGIGGYHKYLKPDSTKIFKAIGEKKLPESVANFFRRTKYWTIESRLSL